MRQLLSLSLLTVVCLAMGVPSVSGQDPWNTNGRYSQRKHRFLGLFVGDGYHVCNPGPDSSWYNPYSRHNQELLIRGADVPAAQSPVVRPPLGDGLPRMIEGRLERSAQGIGGDSASLPRGQSVPWPSESAVTPLPSPAFPIVRTAARSDAHVEAAEQAVDSSAETLELPSARSVFRDLPPLRR